MREAKKALQELTGQFREGTLSFSFRAERNEILLNANLHTGIGISVSAREIFSGFFVSAFYFGPTLSCHIPDCAEKTPLYEFQIGYVFRTPLCAVYLSANTAAAVVAAAAERLNFASRKNDF